MKVDLRSVLREMVKPLFGMALLAGLMTGCGDSSDDPEAVSVKDLKFPGALEVMDLGGGKVKLTWSGSNNEADFDGYNVYGMANTDGTLDDMQGKALELLDDKGEPIQAARDYLAKYNYDPAKGLSAKGDAVTDEGEAKFSALPIHTKGTDDARLLPTCKPNATSGVCDATTAATKGTPSALNGMTTYTVEGLTVGTQYCFLVLSSQGEGAEVSQTSSNVACLTPKYNIEVSLTIPGDKANHQAFDLRKFLAACDTAGSCAAPATDVLYTDAGDHLPSNSFAGDDAAKGGDSPLFIEIGPGFISGANAAVNFLGIHPDGFASDSLPMAAPALTLGDLQNGGGYAVAGQTVPLQLNGMYVVAVSNAATDTKPTDFRYHWIWVKTDPTAGTATVQMRLSKNLNER